VMGLPNTQQLMSREYAGLEPGPVVEPSRLRWGRDRVWASVMTVAATWALLELSGVSEFLYFQF